MKYIKEELENLIFNEKLSYEEIGRRYSVSGVYIKKVSGKLGIVLPIRSVFPIGFTPANKGKRKYLPVFCLNCGKECDFYSKKYCSSKCQQTLRKINIYKDFLENNEKYCRENYVPKQLKYQFLIEQNNKCACCPITNEWNNKPLVFVLDHIDGNAANNKRENLRLVCPNCDSQLDNYKSKNKNSARKSRYLKQRKEAPVSPLSSKQ